MSCRLVLNGGFTVIDSQQRHLQQQARRLGFADLRACVQALLEDGWSIPQLAAHLGATPAAIRAAIADQHLPSHPHGSCWPASGSAPPSGASPPASPTWALEVCGPTWWTGWSRGRGRWRS